MARPKEHKPEAIIAAALSVFYKEGVAVSTARIAQEAGVSNGTLFNYFPTKQKLIDALYVSIKTEMAGAIGSLNSSDPVDQRMRQMWDRWFTWATANTAARQVMNLLHQSGLASADAQAIGAAAFESAGEVLLEAQAAGVLVDLPLDYLAALIQQQLDQAVISELNSTQADIAFGVLWNGITRPVNQLPTKDNHE